MNPTPRADLDSTFMRRALRLAGKGEGRTSPNPMVGALVVKDGDIVGSGWHKGPGLPHAEVLALDEAGSKARGSVVYVTLEPCSHHGRTPPCIDALIAASPSEVVISMTDPDARVSGKGIAALEAAGINTRVGVLEPDALKLNEAYAMHRRHGRPFVTLKSAITLDGKTSAFDGSSKWITGAEARRDVHRLRSVSDAVCVGIGTVVADDPSLTVRDAPVKGKQPLRVVVDPSGRIDPDAKLFHEQGTVVVMREGIAPRNKEKIVGAGGEVLAVESKGDGIDLQAMLRSLASRDVMSLLLEGGPSLAASFIEQDLIDKVVLYIAPKLMGGPSAKGLIEGWVAKSIGDAIELRIDDVKAVGKDIRVIAYPVRN